MSPFGRTLCTSALTAALLLFSCPSQAQWYDDEEAPAGEGEILNPFTMKGFRIGSGGQVTSFIAPGNNILGLTFLAKGGYGFESLPMYIGIDVPVSYASPDLGDSEFVLGNVGINFKTRVDPDNLRAGVFTGWSLDIYFPTFMGDVDPVTNTASLGHATGLLNTLMPAIHVMPEAINVVGTFDLILPGHWLFFQLEVSAAAYFPISDIDQRSTQGAMSVGAALGVHLAAPIAFLMEFKSYTPLGAEDTDGTPLPALYAFSPGFRMEFGPFHPAIWASFPLDEDYRKAWSDVIIGLDLALWF